MKWVRGKCLFETTIQCVKEIISRSVCALLLNIHANLLKGFEIRICQTMGLVWDYGIQSFQYIWPIILYMIHFKVIIRGCICHTYDFPCSLLLLKVFMKSMITLITMRSFKDIWLLRCPRNILWKHESISQRRRIWAISWFCWCMITCSPRMFRKI